MNVMLGDALDSSCTSQARYSMFLNTHEIRVWQALPTALKAALERAPGDGT
jgi:hypothetical protein